MMVRLSADIFVKHLVSLNFINSCLFSSFSANTIEDKLEGAVQKKKTTTKKQLRMALCGEKPEAELRFTKAIMHKKDVQVSVSLT